MSSCLWIILLFSLSTVHSYDQSTAEPFLLFPCIGPCRRAPPPVPQTNHRPVIGILSHPGDGASGHLNNATNASYIAASYVKFVESGGARVIPLIYNDPPEILHKKLNMVNGVVLTGGSTKKGLYFEVVNTIFQTVLKRNDAGDHFPLLAVCLGFELLAMIVSKEKNILEEVGGREEASTLQFVRHVNLSGTAFERFPPLLLKKLGKENLVMEHHHYGVSPEKFQKNKNLHSFFRIVTTSSSRKDHKVYVSTVQGRRYPVTAFQWHPEKNAFEWGLPTIPHSEDAVLVTQNVANFLVREARRSTYGRPSSREILESLIYKHSPTYSGKTGKGFDQVYLFSYSPS